MALFLYQSLAEPVHPAATFPETTSPDKWYVVPEPPPRQPPRASTAQGHFAIDAKQLTLVERTQVDKWYVVPVHPPRQPQRASHLATYANDIKQMVVGLDRWYVRPPDPPAPPRRLTDRECLDYVASIAFDVSAGFPWLVQQPAPRPLPRLTDRECLSFGEGKFTFESVTADRWAHFYPDYLRPTPRLADRECLDFGGTAFTAGVVSVDGWAHFYPDWLRPLPRLADRECLSFGEGKFTFESVTVDRWNPAPNLPVRPSPRLSDREAWSGTFYAVFAATFNPSAGFPWQPVEPPPRPVRRELFGHSESAITLGVFTVEATALDKWYVAPPAAPLQAKRLADRDAWSGTFWAVLATTFNPSTGFPYPTPEPPPRPVRRELFGHGDFATTLGKFTAETVTVDRWTPAQNDPTRNRARTWLGDSEITLGAFTAGVGMAGWYQPTSTPTRPVPRPTDRDCQASDLSTTRMTVAALFPWIMPEPPPRPVRRSGDFLGYSVTVSFVPAPSFGWWRQTSEPVRLPPSRLMPGVYVAEPQVLVVTFHPWWAIDTNRTLTNGVV